MSRFIYKPLTGYTPENRKEFLKLYKESIRKGELLVDLLNYDIYITNDGIEVPIPVTADLRNEIIEFIIGEFGPISQANNSSFLEEAINVEDKPNDYVRKMNLMKNLRDQILEYRQNAVLENNELSNNIKRMNHEIVYFFNKINDYNFTKILEVDPTIEDLLQVYVSNAIKYNEFADKYTTLVKRLQEYKDKIKKFNEKCDKTFDNIINLFSEINAKVDLRKYPLPPSIKYSITAGENINEDPTGDYIGGLITHKLEDDTKTEEIPFPNKPDGIINTETFENVGVNSLNEPIYKITHSVEIDYQES